MSAGRAAVVVRVVAALLGATAWGCGAGNDSSTPAAPDGGTDGAADVAPDRAGDLVGERATPDGRAPAAGGGVWETLAPMPAARQEHGVAAVRGLIFAVGGLAPLAARVEAYDPTNDTWSEHPAHPVGGDHQGVVGVDDKLLVFGDGDAATVWEYQPFAPPAERRWIRRSTVPLSRIAAAVGVIGGKVYLAGGQGPGLGGAAEFAGTELQVYDVATSAWQTSMSGELPPLPVGRNHVAGAVVGGLFYVLGGRQTGTALFNRVDIYDPMARRWSAGAPAPTARGGAAAGVVDGMIIVVGGEGKEGPGGVFAETEAYDPTSDRWITLAPMKTPRHGMGAVGIGARLYVPGGGIVQGRGPVPVVEAFTPLPVDRARGHF